MPLSANRITRLRDADGVGAAEVQEAFLRPLRLAVLLLGPDRGRPRAAGPGCGREGSHARLRARWTHRVAGVVLAPRRDAARLPRWHGDGQHGSWNPSILSGYKVIFVPFENGKPTGAPRDILTGVVALDEREAYGRPVGVTVTSDGGLLVADDVGNVIWHVTGA
jgi:glucose/arabinose dehydrogenase